jgi:hypothetical protein
LESLADRPDIASLAKDLRPHFLAYKKYLAEKGMAPESITKRAQEGKKTVVIDGAMTGISIAVFAKLMHCWANETGKGKELKKALLFHTFSYSAEASELDEISRMGFTHQNKIYKDILAAMQGDNYGLGRPLYYNIAAWCVPTKERILRELGKNATALRYAIAERLKEMGLLKES